MKALLKKVSVIILSVCMILSVSPVDEIDFFDLFAFEVSAKIPVDSSGTCGDNVTWEYTAETGALVISGTGDMYDLYRTDVPWNWLDIYLYSVVIEEGVTSIGSYAFSNCYITSVSIPDTVTKIGQYAFDGCRHLESVDIPDKVTYLGEGAFQQCEKLKSVTIPDGVTEIAGSLFYWCYDLERVDLGENIESIGMFAFQYCESLVEIIGEENASSIGLGAFDYCHSLKNFDFSPDLTYIANSAFLECYELESVTIPAGVYHIGSAAFFDCTSLESFTVDPENDYFCADEYGVLYNKNKTTLIKYPVGNARAEYTVESTVTKIEDYAFRKCTALEKINLPDRMRFFGEQAFSFCESLTDIRIPGAATELSGWLFLNCHSLEEIVIPANVQDLGGGAFENCTSLKSVVFEGKKFESIGGFKGCTSLEEITIPDSVNEIQKDAFYNCKALKTVYMTNSIKLIRGYAFYYCDSLSDIYFVGNESEWKSISENTTANQWLNYATVHYIDHIHSYTSTVIEPTCTEIGYTLHSCTCGDNYTTDEIAALRHDFTDWRITKYPTETQEGIETGWCSRCRTRETRIIEKLPAGTGPAFRVSEETARPGKTVEVTVSVENNPGIVATHLMLSYDSDILTLTDVRDEGFFGENAMIAGKDLTAIPYNVVLYNALADDDYYGDGELITFVFTVAEDAPDGITPVTLEYYADSTFNYDLENVTFAVRDGSVEVKRRLPGDANCDGTVNLKDVAYIERFFVGEYDITIDESNADVNADGKVDLKDSTLIKRYLADWDVQLI